MRIWVARLQEDIRLGRKIATGGFGTVFKGELFDENDDSSRVIVKKVHPTCRSSAVFLLLFAPPRASAPHRNSTTLRACCSHGA